MSDLDLGARTEGFLAGIDACEALIRDQQHQIEVLQEKARYEQIRADQYALEAAAEDSP